MISCNAYAQLIHKLKFDKSEIDTTMASKLEMNIRSLIVHCEEIVKEDPKNWLLKKYIKSLDTMIKELENTTEYVLDFWRLI